MSKMHVGSTAATYTHSLRVTLSLAAGMVEVLKATRIAMRAPASPPSPPDEKASGLWFEIRDGKGELLYHRPLPHSDIDSVEVFDDPKGGAIRRVPVASRARKIDLIVPDLAGAAEFTLHGPEPRAERMRPSVVLDRRPIESLRVLAARGMGDTDGEQGTAAGRGGAP